MVTQREIAKQRIQEEKQKLRQGRKKLNEARKTLSEIRREKQNILNNASGAFSGETARRFISLKKRENQAQQRVTGARRNVESLAENLDQARDSLAARIESRQQRKRSRERDEDQADAREQRATDRRRAERLAILKSQTGGKLSKKEQELIERAARTSTESEKQFIRAKLREAEQRRGIQTGVNRAERFNASTRRGKARLEKRRLERGSKRRVESGRSPIEEEVIEAAEEDLRQARRQEEVLRRSSTAPIRQRQRPRGVSAKLRQRGVTSFQGVPIGADEVTLDTFKDGELIRSEVLTPRQARAKIGANKRKQQRRRNERKNQSNINAILDSGNGRSRNAEQGLGNLNFRPAGRITRVGSDKGKKKENFEDRILRIEKERKEFYSDPRIQQRRVSAEIIGSAFTFGKQTDQPSGFVNKLTGNEVNLPVPADERGFFGRNFQKLVTALAAPDIVATDIVFSTQKGLALGEARLFGDKILEETKRNNDLVRGDIERQAKQEQALAREQVSKQKADLIFQSAALTTLGGLATGSKGSSGSSTSKPSTPSGTSRPTPGSSFTRANLKQATSFQARTKPTIQNPLTKPKPTPKIIATELTQGARFRTGQETLDVANVRVRARQDGKNFQTDLGIVRRNQPLQKDVTLGDLLFKEASASRTRSQGRVRQVNKQGQEIDLIVRDLRSETLGIGERIGDIGSQPSKFISFTKSKIVGEKGDITNLPNVVGAGRARKTAEILRDSGKETIIETINPEFIARKPKKVINPKGLELFKIKAGTSKEITLPKEVENVFLPRQSKSRISRLQSGVIQIGGRQNLNTIARQARKDLEAAASLAQERPTPTNNPPTTTTRRQSADSIRLQNIQEINKFFQQDINIGKLQRTRTVQDLRTSAQKPLLDEATTLTELTLRRLNRETKTSDIFTPRRTSKKASKTKTRTTTKTSSKTIQPLIATDLTGLQTRQDIQNIFKPKTTRKQAQQPRQDQFELQDQIPRQTFDTTRITDPTFNDIPNFTPITPITPNTPFKRPPKRQPPRVPPGKLPNLFFPQGSGRGRKKPKSSGFSGFKPDLQAFAFKEFGGSISSQKKKLKKQRGVGRALLPKEIKSSVKEFEALFEPTIQSPKKRKKTRQKRFKSFSGINKDIFKGL